MAAELDQIIDEAKSILAQCIISANQAAAAAASIGAAGLAPLESPLFTGNPRAPTPAANDASASIATTSWIGAKLGQPNGISTLDVNGIVPIAQLPFAGLNFQGTWDASTNTPTLVSGSGTGGDFYIVSVSGSTNLDGVTTWNAGDWALFAGVAWTRVPYVAPPITNLPLSSLESIAASTVVANTMGGSASPQAVAISSITSFLSTMVGDAGAGGTKGLVPAPPIGSAGSGAFLSADGTFKVPPSPDLSAYAPLNSPAFTGTPTTATIARDTNSTAVATAAFVIAQQGQSTEVSQIKVDGTVSAGTSTYAAKLDHIHPTDTSRVAAANGTARDLVLSGTCTVPTQSQGDNSTRIASTAFVATAMGTVGGGTTFPAGTAMLFAQSAAPTGWTKSTSHNDKAMRVVSGTTGGGSGGSVAFSTFFGRTATDAVTLSEANLPPHAHKLNFNNNLGNSNLFDNLPFGIAGSGSVQIFNNGATQNTASGQIANTGSGTSFSPAIDCRVQYVDVIIATKN